MNDDLNFNGTTWADRTGRARFRDERLGRHAANLLDGASPDDDPVTDYDRPLAPDPWKLAAQ